MLFAAVTYSPFASDTAVSRVPVLIKAFLSVTVFNHAVILVFTAVIDFPAPSAVPTAVFKASLEFFNKSN
jgi:hypothetical protein